MLEQPSETRPVAAAAVAAAALEAALALLVAFVASLVLGFVAFFATAVLVEEGGIRALVASSHRLTIPLAAADAEAPPSPTEAAALVRETLPGADVMVLPENDHGFRLTAWFDEEIPETTLGALVAKLQHSGWKHPDTSLIAQPSLMAAMENPQRMKVYVPSLMTAQAVCFIGVCALMLAWRKPPPFARASRFLGALGWGALAALAAFLLSSLIGVTLHALGLEVEEQGWIRALMADRDVLLLLSPWLVLLGPVSEEVFFRGYVFRRIYARSDVGAYATSAVLFGLIHLHVVGMPMYVMIGLVFCWVYRRAGTLWAPVVAHVLYNGIVLSTPFLMPQ